jgi:hypothetical protein
MTLGAQNTGAWLTKRTGSTYTSATTLSIRGSIRIDSLSGSSSIYSAPSLSVDGFVADFTSAGVVSKENVEWVTGNASLATSTYTITISGFTTAPACTVSVNEASNSSVRLNSVSSTTIVAYSFVTSNLAANSVAFSIHCNKTGSDFNATRTIIGSFKDSVTSLGSNSGAEIQAVHFGSGVNCGSMCTTGTCTICNQTGTRITSVTNHGSGGYRLNGLDNSKWTCTGTAYNSSSGFILIQQDRTAVPNVTYVPVNVGTSGSFLNAANASVVCMGIP